MLNLAYTFPNLANICLHKSITAKFYTFTEKNKDLLEKIREDIVGRASIVFARKVVVNETFFPNSTNWCKSIVGIDATQLYPFSMFQAMPTGMLTGWELDSDFGNLRTRQNKAGSFENMVMSYFQRVWPQCRVENLNTTGKRNKLMHTVLMVFVDTITLCLKPCVAIIFIAQVRKLTVLSLRKKFREELKRGS